MKTTEENYLWIGYLGQAAAFVLSWDKWHAFWWAIVHGIFGWLYVLYYWIQYYHAH